MQHLHVEVQEERRKGLGAPGTHRSRATPVAANADRPEPPVTIGRDSAMFSKMARSMLRGIRVASKRELIDRIRLYFQMIKADPVIFRWKYKMDETLIG
jgi:hypothetical protein